MFFPWNLYQIIDIYVTIWHLKILNLKTVLRPIYGGGMSIKTHSRVYIVLTSSALPGLDAQMERVMTDGKITLRRAKWVYFLFALPYTIEGSNLPETL